MQQLEAVRDRLQKAPTDFGRHRQAAVDHASKAIDELQQGIQFDKTEFQRVVVMTAATLISAAFIWPWPLPQNSEHAIS